jgi:high-affinity K+ transport system ATPase subunit B
MEKSPIAFSLKEGARMVGLGDRKFHQEVLDGKIDVVKIGKRRLVTLSALTTYIDKNTVRAFDAADVARHILGD